MQKELVSIDDARRECHGNSSPELTQALILYDEYSNKMKRVELNIEKMEQDCSKCTVQEVWQLREAIKDGYTTLGRMSLHLENLHRHVTNVYNKTINNSFLLFQGIDES